jgi:prepilin-type processing-associated H-X9-DG protein
MAWFHDSSGVLDIDAYGQWLWDHQGQPTEGWICPSTRLAPIGQRVREFPGAAGDMSFLGTIDQPWSYLEDPTTAVGLADLARKYGQRPYRWHIGSYAENVWISDPANMQVSGTFGHNEATVRQPAITPLFAEAVINLVQPEPDDPAPVDLVSPASTPKFMALMAIPRHGSRPRPVPTVWRVERPLPGAVNVSFFDGHVSAIKPDNLWLLYWHQGYQFPAKRPGLQ